MGVTGWQGGLVLLAQPAGLDGRPCCSPD